MAVRRRRRNPNGKSAFKGAAKPFKKKKGASSKKSNGKKKGRPF